jgi:hypothetical protein
MRTFVPKVNIHNTENYLRVIKSTRLMENSHVNLPVNCIEKLFKQAEQLVNSMVI